MPFLCSRKVTMIWVKPMQSCTVQTLNLLLYSVQIIFQFKKYYFSSCNDSQHRNLDSVKTTGNKAYSDVTQNQKEGKGNEEEADDEYVVPENPKASSQASTTAATISTSAEEPLYEKL